jgi:hypothetical protein
MTFDDSGVGESVGEHTLEELHKVLLSQYIFNEAERN